MAKKDVRISRTDTHSIVTDIQETCFNERIITQTAVNRETRQVDEVRIYVETIPPMREAIARLDV